LEETIMLALAITPALDQPYRGDGHDRPTHIPLPPEPMPLVHALRLRKRWRYVSIWSKDISVCAGSVEVGPVAQEFWAIWDRRRKILREHTRFVPGKVALPPGYVWVRDGDVSIDIELDEGQGLEVVTPDGAAYTWTRKQGGVRARGIVCVGGHRTPVDAMALIDDNAGYHPRHTQWRWSGGAGFDTQGNTVAWSVIVGLNDARTDSERTVWVNGAPREVGPVSFSDDLSRVTFAEGCALHFTEEAARAREDNLVLLRSSYRQPFGSFAGTLPGGIQLAEGYGVMERHEAFW